MNSQGASQLSGLTSVPVVAGGHRAGAERANPCGIKSLTSAVRRSDCQNGHRLAVGEKKERAAAAAAAREQWRGQEASLVLRSCREQFAEKRVPRNAEAECDMWSGALVDLRNSPASTAETLARRSDRAPA